MSRLGITLALVLAGFFVTPGCKQKQAKEPTFIKTSTGNDVVWSDEDKTISIIVDDDMALEWGDYIIHGAGIWNYLIGRDLFIYLSDDVDITSWEASRIGVLVKAGNPDQDPQTRLVYNRVSG